MRVFIIDDAPQKSGLNAAALAQGGHEDLVFSEAVPEGVRRLKAGESASVVLLHATSSASERISACATIRATPAHRDTPIILVSDPAETEALRQALVAGATDALTLPFTQTELLARLRNAMKLKTEVERRRALERELATRPTTSAPAPMIDPDTGALNAAALHAALEWSMRAEPERPITAMVAQLDHFDRYVAAHGDAAAVELRRRLVRIITDRAPPGAFIAAYDADSVAMLVRADFFSCALDTLAIAVQNAIRVAKIPHNDSPVGSTASISIGLGEGSPAERGARPLTDAIARADEASMLGGARIIGVERAAA